VQWTEGPPGTKSYAVTLYDPDAPTGSGWWHWTVFNIPATERGLPENASQTWKDAARALKQGRTDFGSAAYGGPCPPEGSSHRYVLTVWALKVDQLPLDHEASGAMVGFMLNANAIEKASLTLRYGR
jgi:Raf kinase inhibitor-like YbhB/YbcL family protein